MTWEVLLEFDIFKMSKKKYHKKENLGIYYIKKWNRKFILLYLKREIVTDGIIK